MTLSPDIFPDLLGAYITAVKAGDNCQQLPHLGGQSLHNYLVAASTVLTLLTNHPVSYTHLTLPTILLV